jgi:hypothetical protein
MGFNHKSLLASLLHQPALLTSLADKPKPVLYSILHHAHTILSLSLPRNIILIDPNPFLGKLLSFLGKLIHSVIVGYKYDKLSVEDVQEANASRTVHILTHSTSRMQVKVLFVVIVVTIMAIMVCSAEEGKVLVVDHGPEWKDDNQQASSGGQEEDGSFLPFLVRRKRGKLSFCS